MERWIAARKPAPAAQARVSEAIFVAPSDALELQLAKIWESTLGGGSASRTISSSWRGRRCLRCACSQLAVSELLRANASGRFRARLAFGYPVRGTDSRANGCYSPPGRVGSHGGGGHGGPPLQSVVPIQPAGWKPPLFCVHAVGGNVLSYRGVASYLGAAGLRAASAGFGWQKRRPHPA